MGKIYDALEKAKKEKTPTVDAGKSPIVNFYEKAAQKDKPVNVMEPLKLDEHVHRDLVTYLNPQSLESEMFKILRSNILFPAEGIPPQIDSGHQCRSRRGQVFCRREPRGQHRTEHQ